MATKTRKKRVKRPPAQLLGPYDPIAGKRVKLKLPPDFKPPCRRKSR